MRTQVSISRPYSDFKDVNAYNRWVILAADEAGGLYGLYGRS